MLIQYCHSNCVKGQHAPVFRDGDLRRQRAGQVLVGGGYDDVVAAFAGSATGGHVANQNVPEHRGRHFDRSPTVGTDPGHF